jgi:hypothetical protein
VGLAMETTVNQGMRVRSLSSLTAPGTAAELDPTQIQRAARAGKCPFAHLFLLLLVFVFVMKLPLAARDKNKLHYGEGLVVNVPLPESEVEQVVQEVVQNGLIRGTKEYNKDEFVGGAKAATSSRVFPAWEAGGKVFYKVREEAIDPRNFKDSGDIGTLAVRYVVQAQGEKNTVLRIDALFVEDFRRTVHQSNGSVESGEYKDIHQHIEAIEVMKEQNVEAERERQEQLVKKQNLATPTLAQTEIQSAPRQSVPEKVENHADPAPQASALESPGPTSSNIISSSQTSSSQISPSQHSPSETPPSSNVSGQILEDHVKDLRKQVERLVRAPGAPLKSAPFHTASTLQSLATGTEILILISTPYWYGVETHEGQHGWLLRDQVEQP